MPIVQRLNPIGALGQDSRARAYAEYVRLIYPGRRDAVIPERFGGVEKATPHANDHAVGRTQMLPGSIVHFAHALGYGDVLQRDTRDAGKGLGLLHLTVKPIVIGGVEY